MRPIRIFVDIIHVPEIILTWILSSLWSLGSLDFPSKVGRNGTGSHIQCRWTSDTSLSAPAQDCPGHTLGTGWDCRNFLVLEIVLTIKTQSFQLIGKHNAALWNNKRAPNVVDGILILLHHRYGPYAFSNRSSGNICHTCLAAWHIQDFSRAHKFMYDSCTRATLIPSELGNNKARLGERWNAVELLSVRRKPVCTYDWPNMSLDELGRGDSHFQQSNQPSLVSGVALSVGDGLKNTRRSRASNGILQAEIDSE